MQLTLDSAQAEALKRAGQDAIEDTDSRFVETMRRHAREISSASGFVSTDNLRIIAEAQGIVPTHQNAWGAIFRGPHWTVVGRKKSALPSNHHREIRIWRYEP